MTQCHQVHFKDTCHAARLKAAYLKNKPERRHWEEAATFFKWTCGDYPEVQQARELPTLSRLKAAEKMRKAGNTAYAADALDEALLR
jgi:hypothetical protein